jgi:putative CocE/NonD family hydrolase
VTDAPPRVVTDANVWITLADGCRLAARVWRPATAERDPVPAILEYLPYRKGDATAARDESVAAYFAEHGYAYVRVDIRGTGDSDGIIEDEYAPIEQDDALEVIAWIAETPWCTGSVGMIGISWGGFNGLQIAARRPPQLKAVISMCSTDDRYADDVHYLGGCLLGIEMLPWASYMLAINGLPPDPQTVGDGWRSIWLDRLERTPPFIDRWIEHQRRDDYWKHGSVCEDYAAIECPVYMVGGWADGYTNAVPRFLEGHEGIRKGLIGPWPHAWPQHAIPGPRIGFLQECMRWWDRWLKDEANGIEDEPILQVWMQEALTPMSARGDRRGRWVAEERWPSPDVTASRRYLTPDGLRETSAAPAGLQHRGAEHHGLLSGAWCPYGPAADFPSDQRAEDALCLLFDSPPLDERVELLGRPRLGLEVSCDRPLGIVTARLCDVSPDGVSTLLSTGFLNLTHRGGHEELSPVVPGERYIVEIDLNVLGQAIPAGHRLRLAVSTTSWPLAWPSPEVTTLTLHTGEDSFLDLPVRVSDEKAEPVAFGPPEEAPPLATTTEAGEPPYRRIVHDTVTDTYVLSINQGGNERVRLDDADLEMEVQLLDRWTIREGDPLSAEVFCERRMGRRRGDWDVAVETRSRMTADAETFLIDDSLEAFEDGRRVFARSWVRRVPRDHV